MFPYVTSYYNNAVEMNDIHVLGHIPPAATAITVNFVTSVIRCEPQ